MPVDQIRAAAAALPIPATDPVDGWDLRGGTVAWLEALESDATRRAYFQDIAKYLSWCQADGLDPRRVKRASIDQYRKACLGGLANASVARRLSTVSSWYEYQLTLDLVDRNPVKKIKRPKVEHDLSPTVGLSSAEATRFMRTARTRTNPTARRDAAILGLLAELGLRVGEATGLNFDQLGHNKGHRSVRVRGKGGKVRELPIPAPLGRDLDAYLVERAATEGVAVDDLIGAVFVTRTGRRLDEPAMLRLVRRVATEAGIPSATKLSPHSLRHTVATAALDAGAPLRDVQDLLGHADPRTTRRYDRSRGSLDRSPAYLIAGLFAHDDEAAAPVEA